MRVRNGIHLEHDVSLIRKILDGIIKHQPISILIIASLVNFKRAITLIIARTNAQNRAKENINCRNRTHHFRTIWEAPNLS